MESSQLPSKPRVLFICRHNSGRSQMAEAFFRQMAGDRFEVESAGLEPVEGVDPLVVDVMMEEGVDLSQKRPQSLFALFKAGRVYSHVVTVCHASEGKCPVFPGITRRWHRPFPDPAKVLGSYEEKIIQVRAIRDQIKQWLYNVRQDHSSLQFL